jgi:hypothetical protein
LKGEIKMSVFSVSFEAPKIPFRPNQCPNCKNYENKQCTAYTERKQLPFGTSTMTMAAVFENESQEPCPKFASNFKNEPSTKTTSQETVFGKDQPPETKAMNVDLPFSDTSAINVLLEQPYGAAMPMSLDQSGHLVTAFIFRESKNRIAEFEDTNALASMHTKAAFLEVRGVIIYVTLFMIGDQVFEIWWNWHNPVIRPLFESLFEQHELVICFVSDRPEIDRIVRHPSPLLDGLRANRVKLTAAQIWSMDAFNSARAAVEAQFPTPVALWKASGS